MKILVYLERSDVRGGIEIFAERHVEQLRAAGHEVVVANSPFPLPRSPFPVPHSLFLDFDEIIVHKCADVATLEKFPPEKTTYYVHDHEPICPRGYAYTPLKHNCTRPGGLWPCIFCAPACKSWKAALGRVFSQARRKRAMARFRKIVVISEFMKSRLVANGIPAERIAVEPPVIRTGGTGATGATSAANPASPASPASPADPASHQIDLPYVGQLIRGKGVQLLLAAMARMKTARTLDIVGTGNMEPKLKALAARLGLRDRVRFNGFQGNPLDWMRAAKCVVVPSFWQEPYGLVAAEAVALGRPVVAFAIGGLPEACGGRAILVPPGDIAALAKALDSYPEGGAPLGGISAPTPGGFQPKKVEDTPLTATGRL